MGDADMPQCLQTAYCGHGDIGNDQVPFFREGLAKQSVAVGDLFNLRKWKFVHQDLLQPLANSSMIVRKQNLDHWFRGVWIKIAVIKIRRRELAGNKGI